MQNLPYPVEGEHIQAAYHIVPDTIKGGWNVYATTQPQEPQQYFQSKDEAIAYAEKMSLKDGVGYAIEEHEAPEIGR